MDFKEEIRVLAERAAKIKDQLLTEEATKHSLIMPMLQILGYDVFDPIEVQPEYVTDLGLKKGEKIDYAIMRDGVPEILVECKHHKEDLLKHDNQLRRYFHASPARFGILTNGFEYWFFTDLVDANKMDEKPFLRFNITTMKAEQLEGLSKFKKQNFSRDSIFDAVKVLKHTNEIKQLFQKELANPSDDFVKVFASRIYTVGNVTARILQQFSDLTRLALNQYITELVSDKVNEGAKIAEEAPKPLAQVAKSETVESSTVQPTQEELEAYYIVKTILRQHVDASRIVHRDAQSYCAILFDDNNRKTICRLHFNGPKKYLGLFDANKTETKHPIDNLDQIFDHSKTLVETVDSYLKADGRVAASGSPRPIDA